MSTALAPRIALRPLAENSIEASSVGESLGKVGISGTYYLNGPGRFQNKEVDYNNWLDGDGMVTAIRFEGQRVTATTKFVEGRKFVQETRQGRPIFRTFGTRFNGDRLYRGFGTASPYNVSVFQYQDKLLAFGEQSLPMELDPVSLITKTPGKPFDFERQINEAMPFSAHPKIENNGELLNFGIFFDQKNPQLIYYRFDQKGELVVRAKHSIPYPCSVHDFAASENFVVFYLSPHLLDAERLIRKGNTLSESLEWKPDLDSHVVILCRDSGDLKCQLSIPCGYNLHTIEAKQWEDRLVLNIIEYEEPLYREYETLPNLFAGISKGTPVRFEFDMIRRQSIEKHVLSIQGTFDFPVVSPEAPNGFWVLGISNFAENGSKFFDQLVRVNWNGDSEIWQAPHGFFMGGEPACCASQTGQQLLVCPVYDSGENQSCVAIFEANSIASGPLEFVKLGHRIPLGFHSSFCPAN